MRKRIKKPGAEETYNVGGADQGSSEGEDYNPFEQTPESTRFLAYIDAAQKGDLF